MKIAVMQDLMFSPNKPFRGTIVVEIPDITEIEGKEIVAELIAKYPEKILKFEVRNDDKGSQPC